MSSAPGWPVPAVTGAAERRRRHATLAGLVLLAAVLRLHGLGSQLWLDEMDALRESIRRPAAAIVTEWPATTSHVLYDLAAHASRGALGESPFAVRLPAALFGVGGVAALLLFTEPVFGLRVAALAGALLAVSYHHVFYSQNARGYTALVMFALVAARALLGWRVPRPRRSALATYVLACALAAYAIVLGVFVAAGHALVVGADAVIARLRHEPPRLPVARYAAAAAGAAVLVAVLYMPFASHLVRFTQTQARLPAAMAPRHAGPVARLGVATDAIEGLRRGLGGSAGFLLAGLAALLGAGRWARRDPLSLGLLVAPVAVELAALLAADVPLSPRYFALALAPLVVALAAGIDTITSALAQAFPAARPPAVAGAMMAATVALTALPLAAYYRTPKQDFQGAMQRVDGLAGGGDGRVAVHYAARGICGFYGARFADVQDLAGLEAEEKSGRRVWVVTTLERFLAAEAPALHAHIQSSYRRVAVLPATVGGAEMNIYERKEARF